MQPAEDGYLVCAQAMERVRAVSLAGEEGRFLAAWEPARDVQDLEEDAKALALAEIRRAIHEVSARFNGAEQFTKPIDRMDSVDQVMGFVMPFMPVEMEDKQALLEIDSVRERYEAFLELILSTNEEIGLRIEVAQKVSERVGKMNREAMLREQLKVIQEELADGDGEGGDDDYRTRIENSKMPEEVRKKALAEARNSRPAARTTTRRACSGTTSTSCSTSPG